MDWQGNTFCDFLFCLFSSLKQNLTPVQPCSYIYCISYNKLSMYTAQYSFFLFLQQIIDSYYSYVHFTHVYISYVMHRSKGHLSIGIYYKGKRLTVYGFANYIISIRNRKNSQLRLPLKYLLRSLRALSINIWLLSDLHLWGPFHSNNSLLVYFDIERVLG